MTRMISAALLLAAGVAASPVNALTARDVMEKMEDKERFGYLTGLVDMMSYQAVLAGDQPRAECISNAFFGRKDDAWNDVAVLFARYPDKSPQGLVVVLMNKACGG